MNKKILTEMKSLKATARMMKIVAEDIPRKEKCNWSGKVYDIYQYNLYMRCVVQQDILKVAIFIPAYMRMGSRMPSFEVYCSKKDGQFLMYDRLAAKWRTSKLDRINWPASYSYSGKRWISEKDSAIIKDYLGGKREGYDGVLDFQRKVRDRELELRHKKETDPWDKDLERVPELPKDWTRWVSKVGIVQNYLFYHYKKGGAKRGYCTYCGKEVPITKRPYHNASGKCSCCRHEVVFKAIGRAGYIRTGKNIVYLIQRCKEGFVLREFSAERFYYKEKYATPNVYCHETRRVLYDYNLMPRTYYWGVYKQCESRWISCSPCSPDSWWTENGRVYGKTLPSLAKIELRRTGLIQWIASRVTVDPEKYLAIIRNIPQFEQIWKAGLTQLMKECMSNSHSMKDCILAPKEPSLIKALGIDPREFKLLRQYDGDSHFLKWLQYEKASQKVFSEELLVWFWHNHLSPSNLEFIHGKMNLIQIYNYIHKQMPSFNNNVREVVNTWEDYLSMAKRLHMDIDDEIIYRVRKLRQRHDELVLLCEEKAIELQVEEILKDYPHVNDICKSLKEKYEYADKHYAVIVPDGVKEIIEEGRMLHHCVGSSEKYWDRIERRESFVLFLRKKRSPRKNYYTLEVEPDGTVRQKRTEFDRQKSDIEKATEFLAEWQKVIALRLTKDDQKLAEQSRIMREIEFKKLREDRVIIHTGHLAGRLLVDVLLADLMENKETQQIQELPEAA